MVTQLSRMLKAMVAKRRNDNFAGMGGKLALRKVSQEETEPRGSLGRKRRF